MSHSFRFTAYTKPHQCTLQYVCFTYASYLVLALLVTYFTHPTLCNERLYFIHSLLILVCTTLYTSIKSHGVCNRNEYPSRTAIILAVWSLNVSPEAYFAVQNSTTDTVTMPIGPQMWRVMLWTWSVHAPVTLERVLSHHMTTKHCSKQCLGPWVPLSLLQKCAWSGQNMHNTYNLGLLAVCIWWMKVLDLWRDLSRAHIWSCNVKYSC